MTLNNVTKLLATPKAMSKYYRPCKLIDALNLSILFSRMMPLYGIIVIPSGRMAKRIVYDINQSQAWHRYHR